MANEDLNALMKELKKIAKVETDGHVTILKFTTGWETVLYKLNLDI